MTTLAGIDGCRGGWLRIEEDRVGGRLQANVFPSASRLLKDAERFLVLAIDIPIGLAEDGPRDCDVPARKLLRAPRASSVFPAPVRAVLGATSYSDAVSRSEAACGKRMSQQGFGLLAKIADVDHELQRNPALRSRLWEVHPEVCFYFLGGRAMEHKKKSTAGAAERDRLLTAVFGDVIASVRSAFPRAIVADDDIRDALVAL